MQAFGKLAKSLRKTCVFFVGFYGKIDSEGPEFASFHEKLAFWLAFFSWVPKNYESRIQELRSGELFSV